MRGIFKLLQIRPDFGQEDLCDTRLNPWNLIPPRQLGLKRRIWSFNSASNLAICSSKKSM